MADKLIKSEQHGARVTWLDTRINPDNSEYENGVITGEGVGDDGVEFYEIVQAGMYRAMPKKYITAIDDTDYTDS